MLNVPESVKSLYKTDGTRKNFRVHFPGGELPDITNRDIVRESLHFTESVCSQSVFRFGLAEASVLEFEAVGVPNMLGLTIEASIEISTTSLSAAQISAIQADPGDGVLVLAADSDLGYGFYRIPLGTFRVDACPRNHGAMTHRRVTAYSTGLTESWLISPFERWKKSTAWAFPSLTYKSLDALIDANLYAYDPDAVAAKYTRTALTLSQMTNRSAQAEVRTSAGIAVIEITQATTYNGELLSLQNDPRILAVDFVPGYSTSDAINPVYDYFEAWGVSSADIDRLLADPYVQSLLWPTLAAVNDVHSGRPGYVFPAERVGRDEYPRNVAIMYSPDNAYSSTLVMRGVVIPTGGIITIRLVGSQTRTHTWSWGTFTNNAVYKLTPRTPTPMGATFENSGTITQDDRTLYTYDMAYNVPDLLRGWLELSGQFGTEDRGRGFERFALSPADPVDIGPGSYDEAWWDEYDVDPIGTVTLTFKAGEDGEATASVQISSGSSIYDMTDNETLKALDGVTVDSVTELLSGAFASNAGEVGFTPTELTMQGWPWIEAGDALRVTAEDGTVINTYALRVELSGVQNLSAYIVSEGGEIIGEV